MRLSRWLMPVFTGDGSDLIVPIVHRYFELAQQIKGCRMRLHSSR